MVIVCVLLAVTGLSGCLAENEASTPPPVPAVPDAEAVEVACRVQSYDGSPLPTAWCDFAGEGRHEPVDVGADGLARSNWPPGSNVIITAAATGYVAQSEAVIADQALVVNFRLSAAPVHDPGPSDEEPLPAKPVATTNHTAPRLRWQAPVGVSTVANEPHVVVADDGTIYYAPFSTSTSGLHRSDDGGATWELIEPAELRPVGSDNSISLAPGGALWYARGTAYAGGTAACRSLDHGGTWRCNHEAIPGATDRMWIAGLDQETAVVQTNQGLYANVYAVTRDGGQSFVPFAATDHGINVRNGPFAVDAEAGIAYQAMSNGNLHIHRVSPAAGLIATIPTPIPGTQALPHTSLHNGTLWIAGETDSLVIGRSADEGATWRTFEPPTQAKSVTFATIAAGGDGHVVVSFYGSDAAGDPVTNEGTWSLYVLETHSADADEPVWQERQLVAGIHDGPICVGAGCDASARFSGDLMGAWVDARGQAHLAFNKGTDDTTNMYIRQRWV